MTKDVLMPFVADAPLTYQTAGEAPDERDIVQNTDAGCAADKLYDFVSAREGERVLSFRKPRFPGITRPIGLEHLGHK